MKNTNMSTIMMNREKNRPAEKREKNIFPTRMKMMTIFGVMMFMIKVKRIPSNSRIINKMTRIDNLLKTMELMTMIVRKTLMIMKI